MTCRRGEVWWVDWEPGRGVEQAGRRPALIVQNDVGNEFAPATVIAAVTSSAKGVGYPFVVTLGEGEGGLVRPSQVNCSQLMTVDGSRLLQRIGKLEATTMERVDRALRYELGLR